MSVSVGLQRILDILSSTSLLTFCSGWTDTVLAHEFIESLNGLITPETVPQLFKRLAEPDDVASMIVFLLSDDSKFATKGVFEIDGGYIA